MGHVDLCVLGHSPLLVNCFSQKAIHQITQPRGTLTKTQKKSEMKHNPREEFRSSVYRDYSTDGPTRIQGLSVWFKKGIASMALDIESATSKAQLGRCVFVEGERVAIYGTPKVDVRMVRMADASRTPDVRFRAIIPEWACKIRIAYMMPTLTKNDILKLAAAAGMFRGVGENRPEKGSGAFGQYEFCEPTDPRYLAVMKQGRATQDAILQAETLQPEHFYDHEGHDLYEWWLGEAERREQAGASAEVIETNGGGLDTDEDTEAALAVLN